MSACINLETLLFKAYSIGRNTHEEEVLTTSQLRSIILSDVPIVFNNSSEPTRIKEEKKDKKESAKDKKESAKDKKESAKDKKESAKDKKERKQRVVPVDETRCEARRFVEAEHLEDGKLKVMRDEELNQYGDRCKNRKTGDTSFCKSHQDSAPHGVWNQEYRGKISSLIEKEKKPTDVTEVVQNKQTDPSPSKKIGIKKNLIKNRSKKIVKKAEDSDEGSDAEDEYLEEGNVLKSGKHFDVVEIDDIDYFVDNEHKAYDMESEEFVGVLNQNNTLFISGGPEDY
jgi:hypothetical protein